MCVSPWDKKCTQNICLLSFVHKMLNVSSLDQNVIIKWESLRGQLRGIFVLVNFIFIALLRPDIHCQAPLNYPRVTRTKWSPYINWSGTSIPDLVETWLFTYYQPSSVFSQHDKQILTHGSLCYKRERIAFSKQSLSGHLRPGPMQAKLCLGVPNLK